MVVTTSTAWLTERGAWRDEAVGGARHVGCWKASQPCGGHNTGVPEAIWLMECKEHLYEAASCFSCYEVTSDEHIELSNILIKQE